MLSIFSDAMLIAAGQKRFQHSQHKRTWENEREAAYWRHRATQEVYKR